MQTMKKNYMISLDEEKVNILKPWLEKNGMTFSGYMNALIDEQLSALELFALAGDKTKVSTWGLLKMAGKMSKDLKKELNK